MGKSNSFYAVRTGRKPGVYNSWPECAAQVNGVSSPCFQKFDTLKKAQDFVKGVNPTSRAETDGKPYGKKKKSKKNKPNLPGNLKTNESKEGSKDNLLDFGTPDSKSESDKMTFKEIVYTDGSARGNGKPGAKAGVGVFFGDMDPRNYSEPLESTEQTNNRAELFAGLVALKLSSPDKILEIKTDSRYLVQGITSWMPNWAEKGWKTSTGSDVKNRDLFEKLHSEIQKRSLPVIWTHVSAHVGVYGNEMADQLANLGAVKPSR